MRVPVIAGISGREGITTLAAALHGRDAGRYAGGVVDVLVCRPGSLARAAAVPGAAVLVVIADDAVADSVRARLRDVGSRCGAVVLLPHVARWREIEDPLAEATALLGLSSDLRPRDLGPYVTALLAITTAVVRSGTLRTVLPADPVPSRSPSPALSPTPIPTPVQVPAPAVPVPSPAAAIRVPARRVTPLRIVAPLPVAAPLRTAAPVPAVALVRAAPPVPVVERPARPLPVLLDRPPVLLRAATSPPRPVRLAAPVALRPVAGTPLRLRSADAHDSTPVAVAPAAVAPIAVAPLAVPPVAVTSEPARFGPTAVLRPEPWTPCDLDDDALEAEPDLPDLRTG